MPADGSSAVSGTGGKAVFNGNLVLRLKQWSVTPVVSESVWGDSDSLGYTVRKRAREDCTGSLNGVLDVDTEIYDQLRQGDNLKLVLWQSIAQDDYWFFTLVLITSFNLTVDPDTKEVIEWSADFGADGAFYHPGQSGTTLGETLPAA